jgi:hypothetical protein
MEEIDKLNFEEESEEPIESTNKTVSRLNIAEAATSGNQINNANPWTVKMDDVSSKTNLDYFVSLVNECRFFYKNEPLVASIVNRMVEIGINDLVFSKNGLSDNEFTVFTSLKPKLLEFAESMAQEFLLSGLVVPEFALGKATKEEILSLGVKKYSTLELPISMFVRDPKSIVIYTSLMSDQPDYFVQVPDDVAYFIKNNGTYPNGEENKELFKQMKAKFPEFVKDVLAGVTEIPIYNKNVIRRRYMSDNPYPTPFIAPALDVLKHKRKLRQMDYSIADKVIGAILHVKMGSDEFPITDSEEDQEFVDSLRNQLTWRFNSKKDLERIFQLLTSHTVDIKWIFPDTTELVNDAKYRDINMEILYALGFPQTLIVGEASRTAAGDPEMAMIGPIKTMENFRRKIIEVLRRVCEEVALANKFKTPPTLDFKALNLHKFADLIAALSKLYETGGLSRDAFDEILGYDFKEQIDLRTQEQEEITQSGIPQVGLTPNAGNQVQTTPGQTPKPGQPQPKPAAKPSTQTKPGAK